MNILWLCAEPPVPPFSGVRERARCELDYVARRHAVHLLTCAGYSEAPHLASLRQGLASLTVVPYPPRWQGYAPLRPAARRLARQQAIEAVHCQGLELWPAALAVLGAWRVLELNELPPLLESAEATGGDVVGRRRLLNALAQADAIVVVSELDRETLLQWHFTMPIVAVPNGVDLAYWNRPPCEPEPSTVLYPAALNLGHNVEAVRVLVRDVLPRLRVQVPGVQLIVAGRRSGPDVQLLPGPDPSVRVVADPEDMRPLFACAMLVIVPAGVTSGARLKILQALAAGRPVVSSPAGVAGLGLRPGRDVCVADLVDDFANAVARLLGRDSQAAAERAGLVQAGYAAVQRFAWPRVLPALDALYAPDGGGPRVAS